MFSYQGFKLHEEAAACQELKVVMSPTVHNFLFESNLLGGLVMPKTT